MILKDLTIDSSWSLFLDRDGVINKRLPGDYIKKWEEFEFLPGVLIALHELTALFGKLFIVTNQQGIGKGIMRESDLENIHDHMMMEIRNHGGKINKVYHSPYRDEENSVFRKPNIGLARKAKIDFPDISFDKSIMAGDSITDMEFGKNAGMFTVYISADKSLVSENIQLIDSVFPDLESFASYLSQKS
ncbi:MAG: HAD-IIIA family hydrolase [Bacteroidetes bacterium]|nr:HAD-IIIA family hydrolase [Bacteroidota bacterium]